MQEVVRFVISNTLQIYQGIIQRKHFKTRLRFGRIWPWVCGLTSLAHEKVGGWCWRLCTVYMRSLWGTWGRLSPPNPWSYRQYFTLILFINFATFGELIFVKIITIVATRCDDLKLKWIKFTFGRDSARHPAGGAYSAPHRPLAGFKGLLFTIDVKTFF